MTREEFNALVQRFERRYADRPRRLKFAVARWLLLGYLGFLAGWLVVVALAVACFVGALWAPAGWGAALVLLGAVLLALGGMQLIVLGRLQTEPSVGRELRRGEAPALFALLDALRREAGAGRLSRVVLTAEIGAGVSQLPRLGLFGWPRNELHLGLSLLDLLTPRQVEAVLAHEYEHLSRRHGRFGAWLYRVRQTWARCLPQFAERQGARWSRSWLAKFIGWYWPRFNALAFVVSRLHEYQADTFAARRAGADALADSLWRLSCLERRFGDESLPELRRLANELPTPPEDFTRRLVDALAQPPTNDDARRWIATTVDTLTDYLDTHPAFSDRTRAMGLDPRDYRDRAFPLPPSPSGAEALLGARLPALRADVDRAWAEDAATRWRARHDRAARRQGQLEQLPGAADEAAENPELLWERAVALLDLEGPPAAEPLLRRLLELRPDHSAANLVLGRHLLDQGRGDEGEARLRRILDRDQDELVGEACEALAGFFQSVGAADRVREIHERLSRHEAARAAADRERSHVSHRDTFLPHQLDEPALAALRTQLALFPELTRAYLVRKSLRHEGGQPLFVLCVQSRVGLLGRSSAERDLRLVVGLVPKVRLPGRVLVIPAAGEYRRLAAAIRRLPFASLT